MTSELFSFIINDFESKTDDIKEFIDILKTNEELVDKFRLTERIDDVWKDMCEADPRLAKPEYKFYLLLVMSEFLLSKI